MKKNKIIITGGSGFIGSELVKKFKNFEIYIISRKKIKKKYKKHKNILCNLENKKKLIKIIKNINPKIIYHLAWYGIPLFNKSNFRLNKIISNNLIQAVNESNCKKIIISGSCAEYGDIKAPAFETDLVGKKKSSLGTQKNYIRKIFFKKLNKKIICIWARIFYVYGAGQRKDSLLHSIVTCKNKKFQIDNPNIFNDFIYIKDLINALFQIKKINKSCIINICQGKAYSNLYFASTLAKFLKIKIISKLKKFSNEKKILYGSNKILKEVGWKSNFNIKKSFIDILR